MTDALISTVLQNLSKDKYERASDIARRCNCSSVEVKEILIELLEQHRISCKGLKWKQLIPEGQISEGAPQNTQLIVSCPNCKKRLEIIEDYIGHRVECYFCNTKFYISSHKCGDNEYETTALGELKDEKSNGDT